MEDDLILKALDTTNTTTGDILIPEVINPGIRMFVETRSPLWNIFRKEKGEGYAWQYKEQNGLPQASFGNELGALPAATRANYAERLVPYKSIYIRGEISGQLQEASRTFVDVVKRELDNSTMGMVRTLENKLITGDSVANPNEFDGMAKWITTQVYGDTNGNGSGTDQALSLKFMDILDGAAAGGPPTHFIMSEAMSRRLWSVLQPQVRYADKMEVGGGFKVPSYAGKPIIALFDSHGGYLADKVLAPDMTKAYIPVLKNLTYEPLAKTRDSIDYFLRMYLTVVFEGAARHHAKLTDVTSTIA